MDKSATRRQAIRQRSCGAIGLLAVFGGINLWSAVEAAQYDALCGGIKCTIVVTPNEISSPLGVIPVKRGSYWGSTGESKTSVGTGVATTILFGGIGLLGFLAKNHQYNFTVNGFDAEGKQVSMQFEFKNDKPAKLLIQELVGVTGLGMGQTRSVEQIMAAERGEQTGPGVMTAQAASPGPSGIGGTLASRPVESTRNCWSSYLEKNPAMKQWATADPAQAAQNQRRFDAC